MSVKSIPAVHSGPGLFQEDWPSSFRFMQIGYQVEDLRKAAQRWVDVYGVGPFFFMRRGVQKHLYRGSAIEVEVELCVTQAGPVQIELIQCFSTGPNIYTEVFPKGGGLHQLCTIARDYDATVAHYASLGCQLINQTGGTAGGFRVGYIDTYKEFGFITEVLEYSEGFRQSVAKIADICANWDGETPLRYMTRDGFRPA